MPELNIDALKNFCTLWLQKAERADIDTLEGVFDRFFTLWVVFNRLYEEAGRSLARSGHHAYRPFTVRRGNRIFAPPPDKLSATKGIVAFTGRDNIRNQIFSNQEAMQGLEHIKNSINFGMLYLHENYRTGEPDTEKDRELVTNASNGCVESILTLIYQARCNLFHGQKSFTESQRDLLNGMSAILIQVISCAMRSIEERANNA